MSHSHFRGHTRRGRVDTKGQGAYHFMAGEKETLSSYGDHLAGPPWVSGMGDKETDGYLGGVWCMSGGLAPGRVK